MIVNVQQAEYQFFITKKTQILSGTSKDENNFFVNLGNRIKCSQLKKFKGQL